MIRKLVARAGILVGFSPWIVYVPLAAVGQPALGFGAGLVLALAANLWFWRQRELKVLELATLAYFLLAWVATGPFGTDLFSRYDLLLIQVLFATVAWGSLLAGRPFTLQYARAGWPRELWDHPIFLRTNRLITALWGAIFLLNCGLVSLSLLWPSGRLVLAILLSHLAVFVGAVLSVKLPTWLARRGAARLLAASEPYRWPAPGLARARPDEAGRHEAIVIGAGIGGLTSAALLAKRGLKVLVLEQHYLPGGYCTSWERGVRRNGQRLRYVFDAGVHDVSGLGPRGAVRNLLRQLELEQRLDWRRMSHEYVLPGLRLRVPERPDELLAALIERFPAEATRLRAFFGEIELIYHELYADIEQTGGVPCPPRTVEALLRYPRERPHAFRALTRPFGELLDASFGDPSLKQLLSTLTGYLTDTPVALTVGAMAPIFGYYFDGGYYPAGGSQRLADALVEVIRQHGGEVRLRTPVGRIVVEQGRAVGVELVDGTVERAEMVVANADLQQTFEKLVGPEHLPAEYRRRVEQLTPSASASEVFLGVDCRPDLAPITMVELEPGRGVGLAIPSLVDPSLAPPGHSALVLIGLVPAAEAASWDRAAPDYQQRKRRAGDELIRRAEAVWPDLRQRIVYRQDSSPATVARYGWASGGAIYGPALGQWRPALKSPLERLYLVGSAVFPGAGVEAVVISGTLAADAICPATIRTPERLAAGQAA